MLSLKLYKFLVYLILPLACLRLLWRSRLAPNYRKRINERFSYYQKTYQTKGIIVHAVSLGETNAAEPLIKQLIKQGFVVTVTTTTPTGSQRVQELFGGTVQHVYLPYDYGIAVNKFLDIFQPTKFIIMETEWWPNLFTILKSRNIPLLIANARLSERSMKKYLNFSSITKIMADCITKLAAQTQADAQRFKTLGVDEQKINVTGNIKFDIKRNEETVQLGKALKQTLGNRPVWIAASTHPGEEQSILDAIHSIRQHIPNALAIIVPRHPERFLPVYGKCLNEKLSVARRSQQEVIHADTQVYLGDTMGELMLLYAASDVAFIGGSLVPVGGHNMLEAAEMELPIISGSYVFNFVDVVQQLEHAGGLILVNDALSLAEQVITWFRDPAHAQLVGQHAHAVVENNRGALQRMLKFLLERNVV